MLEQIAIFILFLGPLVFFHELGHFFFARFFGVRVETFSIGFGPKLFKFKKGDTDYAVSLIPLGGYVKMFGDDPLSEKEMTPEEEKVAYTTKSKWARFWIVFGGPLANFILAFVIYACLIFNGETVPETRFGSIKADSPLYQAGLRPGDVLKKINSLEIVSFDDLNLVDSKVHQLTISREGKTMTIPMGMGGIEFVKEFSSQFGHLRAPIVTNAKGELFLIDSVEQPYETIQENEKSSLDLIPIKSDIKNVDLLKELKLDRSKTKVLSVNGSIQKTLLDEGYYLRDLFVHSIVMNSAAEAAGIAEGDIITHLNGNVLSSFEELKVSLQKINKEEPVKLTIVNEKGSKVIDLTPRFTDFNGEKVLTIGIYSGIIVFPSKMIEVREENFFIALQKAVGRTVTNTVKIIEGFKRLITGEVSIKNIGGPIAIGKVASDSFNISLSMFFRLMALISLNLGIINLFPIPVLDGGHIVFIFCEMINGGPLSRKKMMVAQQLGVSLLFLLIFVALFNDVTRFF